MKLPTEAEVEEAFVRVFGRDGEALMEQVRALKKKRGINSVESDRLEHAQRQPDRPPAEHWLDKLDK